VKKAGADIILSNHTNYDGSKMKLAALAKRKAGILIPTSSATTASNAI